MDDKALTVVASRLLKLFVILQERHQLLKSGIPLVCEAIEDILALFATELENKLSLSNPGIGAMIKLEALKLLHQGYTKDVNSYHKIVTNLRSHCGLVEPMIIEVGDRFVARLGNPEDEHVSAEHPTAAIVPFKRGLEQLLSNNEVLHYVNSPYTPTNDHIIKSVRDGTIYKEHPVFAKYQNALIIQVYEDDLELVNPLGSRTKTHKLLNIYWMLLNVPDHLRSSLKCINLLASCKSNIIKEYGHSALLADFIANLNKLESDEGLELTIHGTSRIFHGALICANGDGLALNTVGGFKASFSFAMKPCRNCNLTQIEMRDIFVEKNLRNLANHKAIVDILCRGNLSKSEKDKISRDSGVNGDHIFSAIVNFDPTTCFVQDLMHNLLEGVIEVEARVLISYFVTNTECFNLEILNHRIKSFRYPPELINTKPSYIEKCHLENGLRQTASQMLCLLITLPFIVAPFITDKNRDHVENLVLLSQITSRLLAYEINERSLPMLKFMIETHHLRFKSLYPSTPIKPKFHFIVHAPTVIQRFGPSRITWCMRYEGLNSWFSKSAQLTKNFINIEKSLAIKFQINRCADLGFGDKDQPFLNTNEFMPTIAAQVKVSEYTLGKKVAQQLGFDRFSEETFLQSAKNIFINNFKVEINSIVLLNDNKNEPEKPIFGKVCAIFFEKKVCVFVIMILKTVAYCRERFAFEVKETLQFQCYKSNLLPTIQTFPVVIDYDKKKYVVPLYLDMNLFDG